MLTVNEKALLNLALDVSTIYLIAGKQTPEWLKVVGLGVVTYNIAQSVTSLLQNQAQPPQLSGMGCGCGCAKCQGRI